MTRILTALVLSMGLMACSNDDTDDTDDTDIEPDPVGFNVEGVLVNFLTQEPMGNLCVVLVDPTPVFSGNDVIELGTAQADANGAYTIEDIITEAPLAIFVIAGDCADEATAWTSATPIPVSAYDGKADNEVVDGTGLVVDATFLAGMQASLAAVGYTDDLAAAGAIMGPIQDAAAAPIDAATVTCDDCVDEGTPTYYFDIDPADGLFSTGAAINTQTMALAGSLVLIPSAPISNYTMAADGYTFEDIVFGSLPEMVVFLEFDANE